MAQKTIVELIDDIDGVQADTTITFGLDGSTYEIDLADGNADKLRGALAPYVGAARKVSGRAATAKKATGTARRSTSEQTQQIREWARAQGHQVSDRGRIAASVVRSYEDAH